MSFSLVSVCYECADDITCSTGKVPLRSRAAEVAARRAWRVSFAAAVLKVRLRHAWRSLSNKMLISFPVHRDVRLLVLSLNECDGYHLRHDENSMMWLSPPFRLVVTVNEPRPEHFLAVFTLSRTCVYVPFCTIAYYSTRNHLTSDTPFQPCAKCLMNRRQACLRSKNRKGEAVIGRAGLLRVPPRESWLRTRARKRLASSSSIPLSIR
jgi:hypothetical protein